MNVAGLPHRKDGILRGDRLGGLEPAALAAEFGTPLYVYDLDTVNHRVVALRQALPERFDLAYAVKANPSLGIVAHLGGLGVGADVASRGELVTARRAGIPADRIVMTGPGKRDDELAAAVGEGIRAITVESPGELERLERIAADDGRRVPILLRLAISPDAGVERIRLVGDGGTGKFGMGFGDLVEAARRAVRSAHLELLGVHAFGASNVLDAEALATHVDETVDLGARLAALTGFQLRVVDAGGGLGIPYGPHEDELDLRAYGSRLAALSNRMAADPLMRHARVLLEPGRFLVGPAGAYVARIVDRKTVGGREVAIIDGGIHHVLRPALTGQEHRVVTVSPSGATSRPVVPVTIAGALCSGLDVLATDARLREPDVGALVAVLDVGAYGFTESMPYFLSHAIPAEVAVLGGRASLLRPRREPESWLAEQRIPTWDPLPAVSPPGPVQVSGRRAARSVGSACGRRLT